MKFQNPILKFVQTDGQKDGQRNKPKAICPFNFSKVGGIKKNLPDKHSLGVVPMFGSPI